MHEGEAGAQWLERLPGVVDALAEHWQLEIERWLPGGLSSCVLLAGDAVLKIPVRPEDSRRERIALRAWGGHGAVELLAEDAGTGSELIRFLPGPLLDAFAPDEAVALAVPMLHALRKPRGEGLELPTSLARHESYRELIERLLAERDSPFDAHRERATEVGRQLWGQTDELHVVHGDLHSLNVIVSDGRALAIDPFGQLGDPCADIAHLALRMPGDGAAARVDRLAAATGDDADRVHAHAYVDAVFAGSFQFAVGLPIEPFLDYLGLPSPARSA